MLNELELENEGEFATFGMYERRSRMERSCLVSRCEQFKFG